MTVVNTDYFKDHLSNKPIFKNRKLISKYVLFTVLQCH